ncbi:MAG: PIG-L family deacetylase [Clostridiales bacterium]|nr:PIG-L family deacetylase [Clostridiales bacterium]
MFVSILKKAVPLPKLTQFDRYLFVGPHPDDIEIACGGTAALLTKLHKQVTFIIATNGSVGGIDQSVTSEQLVEIRQQEAMRSAEMLGVTDVRFLPYDDGGDYDQGAMKKDIVATILDVQPQVVFCPDYTVPSECHPDHLNVGKVTTEAVFVASWDKLTARIGLDGSVVGTALAYYYTHKPNSYVNVCTTYKLRREAVACHASQFTQTDLHNLTTYFNLREIRFGLRSAKRRAEGYRVLALTHQHCFPEASEY